MSDKKKLLWIHFGEETSGLPQADTLSFFLKKKYLKPLEWHTLTKGTDHFLLTAHSSKANEIFQVKDHINASGYNPLLGHNYDELGPRFPDMSKVYSTSAETFTLAFPQAIIYAGELEHSHCEEPVFKAPQIVYQTIVSMHQGQRPVALILPENLSLIECWKQIPGGKNA